MPAMPLRVTESQPLDATWVAPLLSWLHDRFGHTVPDRRARHLATVIPQLAKQAGFGATEHYVAAVRRMNLDDPVIQQLIDSLTIKETYFFRDRASTQSLRDLVLPLLIERCRDKRVFSVWSAGCSTGEELYSIAILLDELIPDQSDWTISLVGTDLDAGAVERAKRAIYKPWSLRAVTAEERAVYFTSEGPDGHFRLRNRYKRNITFQVHNLANAHEALPGPARFDLILCRNVLIYFSQESQRIVTSTFARALSGEGLWIAGASDPTPDRSWKTSVYPGLLAHHRLNGPALMPLGAFESVTPRALPHSLRSEPFPLASSLMPPARKPEPEPPPPSFERLPDPPRSFPSSSAARATAEAADVHAAHADLELVQRMADAGGLDAALIELLTLIDRFPLWSKPYLLAAQVTQSLGRHDDAVAYLKRALYLSPQDATAHLRIGLLHARRGHREAAVKSLRNAMLFAHLHGDHASDLRDAASRQLVALLQEEAR